MPRASITTMNTPSHFRGSSALVSATLLLLCFGIDVATASPHARYGKPFPPPQSTTTSSFLYLPSSSSTNHGTIAAPADVALGFAQIGATASSSSSSSSSSAAPSNSLNVNIAAAAAAAAIITAPRELTITHPPTGSPTQCPQSFCDDRMNSCYKRYGTCYDTCLFSLEFIDPGCDEPTPSWASGGQLTRPTSS